LSKKQAEIFNKPIPAMPVDVLCIAAHPDDVEMTCAGTVISLIARGRTVAVADLTRGELGTRGTPDIRAAEAAEASRLLGLTDRRNLGFRDGFFRNDEAHQRPLIALLREFRPRIVLTNAPNDRHPDHGRAAELVTDACFLAGLRQISTTDPAGTTQTAHRPDFVYYFIQDRWLKPDFVVDVSPYWAGKLAAIQAYKSQFFHQETARNDEPPSYISGEHFLKWLEARSREHGHQIGAEFGEGFISKRMLGVTDLFDLR
jgi:N-acetylglucosamine malate deacetylase 1